jgi:hypothetical protein
MNVSDPHIRLIEAGSMGASPEEVRTLPLMTIGRGAGEPRLALVVVPGRPPGTRPVPCAAAESASSAANNKMEKRLPRMGRS